MTNILNNNVLDNSEQFKYNASIAHKSMSDLFDFEFTKKA